MKKKILLIQSMQTQGNGTKDHLEERGYKVLMAGSGLTALMLARNMVIDLILLDVALPDIEGMDMCRVFRKRPDTHGIPIILFTARGYQPERLSRSPYAPDDYLEKPFTEWELDRKIAAVLIRKEAAGQKAVPAVAPHPEAAPALITMTQQAPEQEPAELPALQPPVPAVPQPALSLSAIADALTMPVASPQPLVGAAVKQPAAAGHGALHDPAHPLLPFTNTGAAVIDPATGLFGRPQFEAMFEKEFKGAIRFKHPMSLMLIDLDGRTRGKSADEPLVKAVIALVQKTIREVDTAAWWSGESFMVLLPNTNSTDGLQAAARTLETVALHPFSWPDASRVTMNIGVSGLPDPAITTPQQLIDAANVVMRRARELMIPPPFDVRPVDRTKPS